MGVLPFKLKKYSTLSMNIFNWKQDATKTKIPNITQEPETSVFDIQI